MRTIPESLDYINMIYHSSTDVSAMYDALIVAKQTIDIDGINNSNKQMALSLFSKLSVKLGITKYVTGGFDAQYLDNMVKRFAQIQLPIESYPSTHAVVASGIAMGYYMGQLVELLAQGRSNIIDEYDNVVALDIEQCTQLIDQCTVALQSVQSCTNSNIVQDGKFVSIFPPKVKCVDIDDIFRQYIQRIQKDATTAKNILCDKLYNKIIAQCIQSSAVSELEQSKYFPGDNPNSNASITVMCSASDREVLLTVLSRIDNDSTILHTVDTDALLRQDAQGISAVLDKLSATGGVVLFTQSSGSINANSDKLEQLYTNMLHLALYVPIYIHDSSADRQIYSKLSTVVANSTILPSSKLAYQYLAMPRYNDVVQLLVDEGITTHEDEAMHTYLRKYCRFAGYYGLNKAIEEYTSSNSVEQFQGVYSQCSEMYEDSCMQYLRNLTTQSQLIDSQWGDLNKYINPAVKERKQFNYDLVRQLNHDNIDRILNSNHTPCDKAAVLVGYCLLRGDDQSMWSVLSDADRLERITMASQILAEYLCTENIPVVEYGTEEEKKDGWAGLCCAKGKLIKFDIQHAANFDNLYRTLCHEVRHSLQHTIVDGGFIANYHEQFYLCPEVIEEMKYGFENYAASFKTSKSFARYMVQYVESDARLFANIMANCYIRSYNLMGIE